MKKIKLVKFFFEWNPMHQSEFSLNSIAEIKEVHFLVITESSIMIYNQGFVLDLRRDAATAKQAERYVKICG